MLFHCHFSLELNQGFLFCVALKNSQDLTNTRPYEEMRIKRRKCFPKLPSKRWNCLGRLNCHPFPSGLHGYKIVAYILNCSCQLHSFIQLHAELCVNNNLPGVLHWIELLFQVNILWKWRCSECVAMCIVSEHAWCEHFHPSDSENASSSPLCRPV